MTDWLIPALAGFGTGILSAWGIGGGTLLLLIMALFLGVEQTQAQGINLLYFLPTAGMSLIEHRKNGYLDCEILRAAPHSERLPRLPRRGRQPGSTLPCSASPSGFFCSGPAGPC